jgi:hypothetical protein
MGREVVCRLETARVRWIYKYDQAVDDSGALPELMQCIPDTPIYCTTNGVKSLTGHYHQDWNFVGAGIFGFLINMPVVSYFEAGTILTLNHGHAALLGAFGMLAMALLVLGLRHVLTDEQWVLPEKFIKMSFWGLNIGLALMVITNLFPEGILQIWDVLENGITPDTLTY